MAQQVEEENDRRDYFWVKIVVGLVLVTIASLLISKLAVPWASRILGDKNRPAVTDKGNTTVFEETGKMVQGLEKENAKAQQSKHQKKGAPQLTEEESAGQTAAAEEPKANSKTDVKIEKVETENTEATTSEQTAEPEKPVATKEKTKKSEKAVAEKTSKKKADKESAENKKISKKKAAVEPEEEESAPKASAKEKKKAAAKAESKEKTAAVEKEKTKTHPKEAKEVKEERETEKPKAAAASKPAPKQKETKEPEKAGGAVYVLQLGNFTSQENANQMKKILVDQYKLEVFIKKIQYEGQTRFRVQAGAFKDKANAQKLARELQIKGYNSYIASEGGAGK